MTSCLTSRSIASMRAMSKLRVLTLLPDFLRRGFGNDSELGHGIGGMRLDLEPDAIAGLRLPDRGHFRPSVARDHVNSAAPAYWAELSALPDRGSDLNSHGFQIADSMPRLLRSRNSLGNRSTETGMKRSSLCVAGTAIVVAGLSFAQPTLSQEENDQRLGTVHFQTPAMKSRKGDSTVPCGISTRSGIGKPKRFSRMRPRPIRNAALPIGAWRSRYLTIRMTRRPSRTCRSALPPSRRRRRSGAKTQRERDYIDALVAHVCGLRQDRPSHPRSVLSQGDGGAGAGAIPMTTRRRSHMPSRSMSRPRRATRPMPTSSRARRSSSRSSSASPSTPASPTI